MDDSTMETGRAKDQQPAPALRPYVAETAAADAAPGSVVKGRHWAVDHARKPVLWMRSMDELEVQGVQWASTVVRTDVHVERARTRTPGWMLTATSPSDR